MDGRIANAAVQSGAKKGCGSQRRGRHVYRIHYRARKSEGGSFRAGTPRAQLFRRLLDLSPHAAPRARDRPEIDRPSRGRTCVVQFAASPRQRLGRASGGFSPVPAPSRFPFCAASGADSPDPARSGLVLAFALGGGQPAAQAAGATAAALLAIACGIHHAGWRQSKSAAIAAARTLAEANRFLEACVAASVSRHQDESSQISEEYERTCTDIAEQWNRASDIEVEFEKAAREKILEQTPRLYARNKGLLTPRLDRNASERSSRATRISATTRNPESIKPPKPTKPRSPLWMPRRRRSGKKWRPVGNGRSFRFTRPLIR